jgi:hypothetical protein
MTGFVPALVEVAVGVWSTVTFVVGVNDTGTGVLVEVGLRAPSLQRLIWSCRHPEN